MAVQACDVRKKWRNGKAGHTFSTVKSWRMLAEGGLAGSWQRWDEVTLVVTF